MRYESPNNIYLLYMERIQENILKKITGLFKDNSVDNNDIASYFATIFSIIMDIDDTHPLVVYQKNYILDQIKTVKRLIKQIDCNNVSELLNNDKIIMVTMINPLLVFWKEAYFKRKMRFFNSQKFGSRKINNAIYEAVTNYIEDTNIRSNKVQIGKIKSLLKSKVLKDKSFLSVPIPSSDCIEEVSANINFSILMEESDILQENFFKRTLNKTKNLWEILKGNRSTLQNLIFKVANKLNLDYSIIVYVLDNMDVDGNVRNKAREKTISTRDLARIISQGLSLFLYEKVGTPKEINKVFKSKNVSIIVSDFIKTFMVGDKSQTFINYIDDEIYDEVNDIYKKMRN